MAARAKSNPLLKHLPEDDVLTSSELIALICKRDGESEANARQLLSRNANAEGVWRSERLRLPKDERLFARKKFMSTPYFYVCLGKKLLASKRRGLARCLEALGNRTALHKTDVMRLLAVSEVAIDGQDRRLYQEELAGLEEIGAVVAQRNTPLESLVVSPSRDPEYLDELANQAAAAVRKESLLARILADRLRRQNMFSWNRVELPDPERPFAVFNGQIFSSFAFSYLSPLVYWKKEAKSPTPCPVLFDVYEGQCLLSHVQSFIQRIERATIRGRSRMAALGVIAAKDFDREAWTLARRSGLMTVSFRQMFGDEALKAMVLVEELLHDISRDRPTADADNEFDEFADLLKMLKTNPVVVTLRSIGFEILTGFTLRSMGYERVELGRIATWQNTTRDIDAFGFRGDQLRVVECKAYHRKKSIPEGEVKKFFTETLPALKKMLRDQGNKFSSCVAELWTTGPLGREARDELYKLKRPEGDTWTLIPGDQVQQLLPNSIKQRGTELLSNIAMEETQDEDAPEATAMPEPVPTSTRRPKVKQPAAV